MACGTLILEATKVKVTILPLEVELQVNVLRYAGHAARSDPDSPKGSLHGTGNSVSKMASDTPGTKSKATRPALPVSVENMMDVDSELSFSSSDSSYPDDIVDGETDDTEVGEEATNAIRVPEFGEARERSEDASTNSGTGD